jgi:hypothetical protein
LTLLWKKSYLPLLLSGEKTATRRTKRPLVKEGRSYFIRSGFFTHLPQRIKIDRLYTQRLCEMNEQDASKEGTPNLKDYIVEWQKLYGDWKSDQVVWVVEFHLDSVER